MKRIVIILAIIWVGTFLQAQDKEKDIAGQWNGVISIQGVSLRIIFHINKDTNGYKSTMDSPDQGATGIPVATTKFDGSMLSLEVPNLALIYEGDFKTDSIAGILKQGTLSVPMTLKPGTNHISVAATDATDNGIVLKTSTGDISGALLALENETKDIIVLFICGSGPTDRNGNNLQMPNNSIRFLAEDIYSAGIPSVRYDKRGIAASAAAGGREDELRFSHYVDDARAWIDFLCKDYNRVVVIGHSEGAQIGVLAAIGNPNVAAVVTIAGAGRKLDEVIKAQLAKQSEQLLAMAEPLIESLKNGATIAEVPPVLVSLFRPSVQPYLISWFATDPAAEIARLTVPVLIIQGETDIQTSPEDATLLQKAQPQAKMVIIPNMNHVFKECSSTDRMQQIQTYMNPNLKNIPVLSHEIIGFIESVKKMNYFTSFGNDGETDLTQQ